MIENPGGGGAYITVPFDVGDVFGKKRVKIIATIDGEPYRGTLVRMGEPDHILLVLKEIREKIGKSFGNEVEIELEEDTAGQPPWCQSWWLIPKNPGHRSRAFFHVALVRNPTRNVWSRHTTLE
jgi:hypothetical protein